MKSVYNQKQPTQCCWLSNFLGRRLQLGFQLAHGRDRRLYLAAPWMHWHSLETESLPQLDMPKCSSFRPLQNLVLVFPRHRSIFLLSVWLSGLYWSPVKIVPMENPISHGWTSPNDSKMVCQREKVVKKIAVKAFSRTVTKRLQRSVWWERRKRGLTIAIFWQGEPRRDLPEFTGMYRNLQQKCTI